MKNDHSIEVSGHSREDEMGWAQAELRGVGGHSKVMRRVLAFVVVGGFFLMACTPKTPEQRYADRMSRLTKQIEKLQGQIHEEQQKEIQRRRDAQETLR